MARLFTKLSSFFSSRTLVGVDKTGNRYFTRKEDVDGISASSIECREVKEKRWVVFKSDPDPTSIPVEWICWLNGQRKRAPTSKEVAELEAKREQIKQNVALLKKEEEEKKLANVAHHSTRTISKDASPDLKSFIKQFPSTYFSKNGGSKDISDAVDDQTSNERPSEPSGSGVSFKPGTWQPPT